MDIAAQLAHLDALIEDDPSAAFGAIGNLVTEATGGDGHTRDLLYREVVARANHAHPQIGAMFALAGGVLIEHGSDARALAKVIPEPLERALETAMPLIEAAMEFPIEPEITEEEGEYLAGRLVPKHAFGALLEAAPEATGAYFSLDMWYRPAAASWTRDPPSLREAQRLESLGRAADAAIAAPGVMWIRTLLKVVFDAPVVIYFSELNEAYRVRLDGISDMGQLTVLLSDLLHEPLARIGLDERPTAEMLACMRGSGPQSLDITYGSALHLYPWQTYDAASALPRDEVFEWRAPGGRGNRSLPPDYLPGDLIPLEGERVLLAVGPNTEGFRFRRLLPLSRLFGGLRASVSGAEKLSSDEVSSLRERLSAAAIKPHP